MAKKTLLDIVQNAMTSLGDDPVNSINDSPESEDMAALAEQVFLELSTSDEWPDELAISSLNAVADSDAPTTLYINDDYRYLNSVQYQIVEPTRTYFRTLDYVLPERFIAYSDMKMNQPDTEKSKGYGILNSYLMVGNRKDPSYYTTFDNKHIILDSFDWNKESTVQESNARVWVVKMPEFQYNDSFVFDYSPDIINLFMAQLRVAASFYFNQQDNPRDRKMVLRILNKLRKYKGKVPNDAAETWPQGQYYWRTTTPNIRKLGRR